MFAPDASPDPSYQVFRPARLSSRVIFASPHSGRHYPQDLMARTRLDARQIRSSEDAFVDQLFAPAVAQGAALLVARLPRAYVDLNRAADELDPALIEGAKRRGHNPRIASGLGVIPRVVSGGRPIYSGKITMAEAEARLERCWHPYHAALQGLMGEVHRGFGEAVLVDCHSMPHEALDSVRRGGGRRPDVVIGDRFGASARPELVEQIEAAFAGAGLNVVRNAPFAGAYVTQHYGRPGRGRHAIQVEIDRALYMDEARIVPRADFDAFATLIRGVIAEIAGIGGDAALPLAAE